MGRLIKKSEYNHDEIMQSAHKSSDAIQQALESLKELKDVYAKNTGISDDSDVYIQDINEYSKTLESMASMVVGMFNDN